MSSFRLQESTKKWFKHIEFEIDFDMYYFCLMAGLSEGKKAEPSSNSKEFLDYFPNKYLGSAKIIVATFVTTELKEIMGETGNKKTLNEQINKLIDPNSSNHLTEFGTKEMNKYSFGGYEILSESWFTNPPRTLEYFLPTYFALVNKH